MLTDLGVTATNCVSENNNVATNHTAIVSTFTSYLYFKSAKYNQHTHWFEDLSSVCQSNTIPHRM